LQITQTRNRVFFFSARKTIFTDQHLLSFQIAKAGSSSYRFGMSNVERIKAQIDALTWQERCELNALLQDWSDDDWDRQMAAEGKFDRMMEDADREYRAGQCREWPRA
jgi:hypothetical protein